MAKKQPNTPRSKVRAALRQLWLRSRERAAALKKTGYCCERCNVKQSKAKGREQKIEVHHVNEIDWDGVIDLIVERLLAGELEVLCPDCHDEEHIARKVLND